MTNNHSPDWNTSQVSDTTSSLNLPLETRLRLSDDYDSVSSWRQLSRYIARHPHDLRVHAQRILLCPGSTLEEYLPGALQDLHLSLSGAGQAFSKRLLEQVKTALTNEDIDFFSQQFESREEAKKYNSWRKGSVLTNGTDKGSELVEFVIGDNKKEAEFSDPLEEALSCIEYGQLDVAQEILEKELLSNSGSEAVEEELLNLYQYTRNAEQLRIITDQLHELGIEPSEFWKQYQNDAVNWNK